MSSMLSKTRLLILITLEYIHVLLSHLGIYSSNSQANLFKMTFMLSFSNLEYITNS